MLYGLAMGGLAIFCFIVERVLAMFCFIVKRLYREFRYWFGFSRSCKEEDSKLGDAYVHQLIRNITDDRRSELDPCCLNDCFTSFLTFLLTFIKTQRIIEFGNNSITGLTSLKQADSCCLTKKKDRMHISACLGAGPIQFDSWVTINVLGIKRRLLVKGTLRYVKILCDFTVDSEIDRNGSLERLFIRELKEIKFWVREGLGFLKVLINPVISLIIVLLKTFVRHGIECALESYVRKTFPKYKFPLEGNASENNAHNPEVLEDPSKSSQVSRQNNSKLLSSDSRSPDLARKPSQSNEKCASKVVEQSKAKIKNSTSQTSKECCFLEDFLGELDGSKCIIDAFRNEINTSIEFLDRFSSSEGLRCMTELQVVDVGVASEQDNQIWSSVDGIPSSDEISLCKSKLNDTFQNALKYTPASKNLGIDHFLTMIKDGTTRKKTSLVNSEGHMSKIQINQNIVSTREQSVEIPFLETTSQCTLTLEKGLGFNTEDTITMKSAHGCIPNGIKNRASKNIVKEVEEYLSSAKTNSIEPISDVEKNHDCQPFAINELVAALYLNQDEVLIEIIKNNEERRHSLQKLTLPMEEILKDTKIAFEKPLLQHKLECLEKNLKDSEQITTLPFASDENYERIKDKVKIFHETEIREYTEETLPYKDEVEYAASTYEPENVIGEEGALEKLPLESEVENGTCICEREIITVEECAKDKLHIKEESECVTVTYEHEVSNKSDEDKLALEAEAEKVYATCVAKVATEEAQVMFPLEVETKYLASKNEPEDAIEEARKVTSKVETEYMAATNESVDGTREGALLKLPFQADVEYFAAGCERKTSTEEEVTLVKLPFEDETKCVTATCQQITKAESDQEILHIEAEAEKMAATCVADVTTQKAQEKLLFEIETECTNSTNKPVVVTGERTLEKLILEATKTYVATRCVAKVATEVPVEKLPIESEAEFEAASCVTEVAIVESEEKLPFEDETEYVAAACVDEVATEEAQEKLLGTDCIFIAPAWQQITNGESCQEIMVLQAEDGNESPLTKGMSTCVAKVATEETREIFPLQGAFEVEGAQEKFPFESETERSEYEFISGDESGTEENFPLEVEYNYVVATCQKVEKVETAKEILPIEIETEYAAAPCVAEVAPEKCQEKQPPENEPEYAAAPCVTEVAPEKCQEKQPPGNETEYAAAPCVAEVASEKCQGKQPPENETEYAAAPCVAEVASEKCQGKQPPETEYAAAPCVAEVAPEKCQEKQPPENETEYAAAPCVAEVASEKCQGKQPPETEYAAAPCVAEVASEKCQGKQPPETEYAAAPCVAEVAPEKCQEKQPPENETEYAAAPCVAEVASEKCQGKQPPETEYAAAPCVAEVAPEKCQEKQPPENETEYLISTCEPKAHASKQARKLSPIKIQIKHAISTSESQVAKDRLRRPRKGVTREKGNLCPLKPSTGDAE